MDKIEKRLDEIKSRRVENGVSKHQIILKANIIEFLLAIISLILFGVGFIYNLLFFYTMIPTIIGYVATMVIKHKLVHDIDLEEDRLSMQQQEIADSIKIDDEKINIDVRVNQTKKMDSDKIIDDQYSDIYEL